jgi:hypothetical protein
VRSVPESSGYAARDVAQAGRLEQWLHGLYDRRGAGTPSRALAVRASIVLLRRPPGRAAGPGRVLFGGRGALDIPPLPTWAMITVIAGWIVGWPVIGAWRMVTRDA